MEKLIGLNRSIIVACDVSTIEDLKQLVKETAGVKGIGGYKVGAILAIKYGLVTAVSVIKEQIKQIGPPIKLPVIYDHQKAGTDIPALGHDFIEAVASSGADALILFPFGGWLTLQEWIASAQKKNLKILIGGHMTQDGFLEKDGGFIADNGPARIYRQAAKLGIQDFVLPGNRLDLAANYRQIIIEEIGKNKAVFYAPGFGIQEGKIDKANKILGNNWHAIVGRAIYEAKNRKAVAEKLGAQIMEK